MAWDDDKQVAPGTEEGELTPEEWNEHVADQKGHSGRHENGGTDELDVSGLSGVLADAQTPQTDAVQDIVGALIQANGNISVTYDDENEVLTIDTSALNTEEVEDAVAELVTAGNAVTVNYDDDAGTLSIGVDESALSFYDGTNLTAPVDNQSVDTEGLTIDDTYFWASEFDGADADSRLSNALTEVPEGSTIFLENAEYLSNRTIEKRLSLTGTGRVDGDGTTIAAEWTLDEIVSIHRVADLRDDDGTAKIIINRQRCEIHSVYGTDEIVVQADDAIITNIFRADITFEDGTSDGIVDSCTGSSIVDNGSNTVGDIA